MYTIRVVNYLGDYDDLGELILIGPYPTAEARNVAWVRLANLPGVYGNLGFDASELDPSAAPVRATPDAVAGAVDCDTLVAALFGWKGDGEPAEIPGQMALDGTP